MAAYRGMIIASAVGANKVHMDLFNGSPGDLLLRSFKIFPTRNVAVVGVLAALFSLTRTSAVGTGGTAATANSTSLANPSIVNMDGEDAAIASTITMRAAPGGGATAGALLGTREMFMEETAAYADLQEFLTWSDRGIIIPNGTGIRLVQGSVASVGSVNIEVDFETNVSDSKR